MRFVTEVECGIVIKYVSEKAKKAPKGIRLQTLCNTDTLFAGRQITDTVCSYYRGSAAKNQQSI